jgi:hypothetical protein
VLKLISQVVHEFALCGLVRGYFRYVRGYFGFLRYRLMVGRERHFDSTIANLFG